MKKLSYRIYHRLFFYFWSRGSINFFNISQSRVIIESKLGISWLRFNTKYVIEEWLKSFYESVKKYDGDNTDGILQFPSRLREMSIYSYLVSNIGMGYHPTLKTNPIFLEEILDLNPYKKDKTWTIFLEKYLTHHWTNPGARITKSKLNNILNH